MKKNILVVVSLIAVVALATVAVRQNRQITQLKEQLASAAAEKSKALTAPTPVVESREPLPEVKPAEPAPSPAPSAPVAPTNASTGTTSNYFAGLANMMKNPQMKEMIRGQQKVMLDRMYGSLGKYMDLPADRMDALKQLLLDRQMAMVDTGMSMMGGSAEDRKQAVEESKAIKADYDQKIQELLGSQDYPVFQEYEKTQNERMSVQMFKDALPATDALTDQQEDNLIAAMYQERQSMPSPLMNTQNQDPSQLTEEHIAELQKQMEQLQQKYAERAAGILTPAQLEQYTKWQQQWNSMQMAGLKMAAQMFGNKGTTQAPAATQGKTP